MPLNAPPHIRAAHLNKRYKHHGALSVLERAFRDAEVGKLALVSSFGAESVVLLHMISRIDAATPVLFIDTEMLFAQTLQYQTEVADKLNLSNVQTVTAKRDDLFIHDNEGLLHLHNPDACCALRKTEPLQRALAPYDAWITGRKRFQAGSRADLEFFEDDGGQRLKVNPLAHWAREDVAEYMTENRLPRHPLVAQGYPSIGCAPCTSPVGVGEDPRAGRWRDQTKEECGIHIVDGKVIRGSAA
ncbi:phosphoadenylyl-sulfate reductase [Nereida sp. MMG025]|uniref:phosphoadenylyl-sulfate reductase n=1 Tax=Nereida sp. MMG025 TaxID=2909981 RepID=UPI001F009BC3|nr:phosphoadenylyl-sulfate reductase [Nereida sp. MMG025]MCF6445364.1 phosphoadenylyl-sulfate reductase [Nereida sp. MMG025]